jgi:chromosome segregation ATPase
LDNNVGELNTQISSLTETNENLTAENAEYSTKIGELEENISTLSTERDEARSNYDNASARVAEVEGNNSELNNTLASITAERDELITYKKGIEDDAKRAVISNYVETLPDEVIESYMNSIDNYTIDELDKELTYEQKKANPNLFSKTPVPAPNAFVPKDDEVGGINNILARFEKH